MIIGGGDQTLSPLHTSAAGIFARGSDETIRQAKARVEKGEYGHSLQRGKI